MRIEEPTKVQSMYFSGIIHEHHPVYIGEHNFITGESKSPSYANTAAALNGLRGQDILDVILTMEIELGDGHDPIPAAQFDTSDPKKYRVPIVTSLGALYQAVDHLITRKIISDNKAKNSTQAKRVPNKNKRKSVPKRNKPSK